MKANKWHFDAYFVISQTSLFASVPNWARDSDFWICSSMVIWRRNLRKPSSTGLLLSFVFTDFNLMPNWISFKNALRTFSFSVSYTNWPWILVIVSDFRIGFDRSFVSTWRNFFPDSTSFIMSDQSGRRRGRDLSLSSICFCLSFILSISFESPFLPGPPGGGGGAGGAGGAGGGGGGTEIISIIQTNEKYDTLKWNISAAINKGRSDKETFRKLHRSYSVGYQASVCRHGYRTLYASN